MKRCSLAHANERRDARLFAEVAEVLMRRDWQPCAEQPPESGLDGELFATESTLIEPRLSLFPWARRQGTQAAAKLGDLSRPILGRRP